MAVSPQRRRLSVLILDLELATSVLDIPTLLRTYGIDPVRPYTRLSRPDLEAYEYTQPPLPPPPPGRT
jgi:hypothetical protein